MIRRPLLLVVAVLLGLIVIGLLVVSAFPPAVQPQPVEKVLPNDRFQTR